MRWCLIVACVLLARVAGLPSPTTTLESQTTLGDISTENITGSKTGATERGSTESVTTTTVPVTSTVNSTQTPGNVTGNAQGNSSDPQCKSDEKLIEDPTNCHVLCSKGALFYYSAGRKPNGTECVINKYLEGTKHIESSKPGDCFKGQCIEKNGTATTGLVSLSSTTNVPTTLSVVTTSSSEASSTTGATAETEVTSSSSPVPATPMS